MTPDDIRTLVILIRKFTEQEWTDSVKLEAIECEASDQDMLAIHDFCSLFTAELDEGHPEGGTAP